MKKVILITGASSGIGKATARKLISEGHIVYGVARRIEKMKDLKEMGGHIMKMDVTDANSISSGVGKVLDEQRRIDVLVNNAGYGLYGAVEDVNMDDARHQFEVNLFGLAEVTKAVLPVMRNQKSGLIINTSSMGGKIYMPLGAWYHASKHALEGWSDALRLEVKQYGIDVVLVEPGIIGTEFGDVMVEPMVQQSRGGAYEELSDAMARATTNSYRDKNASPPSVIADVVSRAINSSKPKTRYAAGKMAKLMIWMRTYLGDRLFDRLVMSQIK